MSLGDFVYHATLYLGSDGYGTFSYTVNPSEQARRNNRIHYKRNGMRVRHYDYVNELCSIVSGKDSTSGNWKIEDGKIVTEQLADTTLQPGESTEMDIILTWINGEDNMGVKDNWAEISEDDNESDTPDIDSTPNNRKEGEDDIDDAPVALTVVAGKAQTYIAIISGTLLIIGGGIFLIKKYVV